MENGRNEVRDMDARGYTDSVLAGNTVGNGTRLIETESRNSFRVPLLSRCIGEKSINQASRAKIMKNRFDFEWPDGKRGGSATNKES